jgi:soluble lytic murein transglycosylase-like protein
MAIAARQIRPAPCSAIRRVVACALVLATVGVLRSGQASEQPILPASFDARFAAVEAAAATSVMPVDAPADPPRQISAAPAATEPPRQLNAARAGYRALIEREAKRESLAPEIAEAVMAVESGYNPAAIGGVGEIGLMQILPSTARMLGFVGSNADLAVPETNIRYGVTYLAQAWRLAGGDLCTAVMKYRAGHGETRFSFLSVNYCLAVRSKLAARGFAVSGSVPVATFGEAGGTGCKRKCLGGSRIGHVNLAALNMQLSALVVQVRAAR